MNFSVTENKGKKIRKILNALQIISMVGTCRAQVISLLQSFFRSISLLESDDPLVDDITSTGWLMKATQSLLKWPGNLNRSLSADILSG